MVKGMMDPDEFEKILGWRKSMNGIMHAEISSISSNKSTGKRNSIFTQDQSIQ